jgi:LPXTG-motif cell wall-anchored protein
VTRTSLPRRLLASAAGLAIGLGGALALAAPAQAVDIPVGDAGFFDVCHGTYVGIETEVGPLDWQIKVGGETFWPEEEDSGTLETGESEIIFVPKGLGEIEVSYVDIAEPWIHTWSEPDWCEEPTYTQPTCDEPGTITIPGLPKASQPDVTHLREGGFLLPIDKLIYRLDDEVVEPESTHEVEPGTHVVTLTFEDDIVGAKAPSEKLLLGMWIIEIEEPECDLPHTGTQVALIAGGALLLLTLGSAAYFLARRRQISFTA